MCDSHKHYIARKKPNERNMCWTSPPTGSCRAGTAVGIEIRAVVTSGGGEVIRKRHNKSAGVMDICRIFGEVVAAQMSAFAKTHGLNI